MKRKIKYEGEKDIGSQIYRPLKFWSIREKDTSDKIPLRVDYYSIGSGKIGNGISY
jgi:hypothetical protein